MATLNIDGKEYESEDLSQTAKDTIVSLKFVQGEIKRLEATLAVYKTAATAYTRGLKEELPSE